MPDNELFLMMVPLYQEGKLEDKLDDFYTVAAQSGIVLLPGEQRAYTEAKGGAYKVDDLLLPFNQDVWKTITDANRAGMDVFPAWFSYNSEKGYYEYTQEDLCTAFINHYHLKQHRGIFFIREKRTNTADVREKLFRSLAIVRKDAGSLVNGAFLALKTICQDDAPASESKPRLSIDALAHELHERGYSVRTNVVTGEYETLGRTDTDRKMSQDDLMTVMHDALSDDYKGASFETLTQYISYLAREDQYNPVLELLSSTKWDGIDRLPQLYSMIGIESDELSKVLVRKWLYQAVALLFNDPDDPFGADGCLVLNGEQGAGKTSLFRRLALRDMWFAEGCSIDDRDKDTSRRVITCWISELGEVESTLKSDISKLKAFVTAGMDKYRLPYGKSDIVRPRVTSLCATCNSDRYLIDPTGNRRWWSVPFVRIVPHEELMEFDALQLWSQIYSIVEPLEYKDKAACFRLTQEENRLLAIRNGEFEKPTKGQDEVADILDKAERDHLPSQMMLVSEFKSLWDILRAYSANQIGVALKRCGVEINHTKRGNTAMLPKPFTDWKP